MKNRWTTEMEAYLIVQRTVHNTTYKTIAVRMNKKFGTRFAFYDLQYKAKTLGINNRSKTVKESKPAKSPKPVKVKSKPKTKLNYFKPSQEQINFIHGIYINYGRSSQMVRKAYLEHHGRKLTNIQIATTLKKPHTLVLPKEEVKPVVTTVEKAHKAWHDDTATKKQCRCIIALTTDLTGKAKNKAVDDLYNSKEYTKLEARDFIKANEEQLFKWKSEQGYSAPKTNGKFTHEENFKVSRWTPEEDNILYTFKMDSNKPLNALSSSWPELEGRTQRAVRERWYRIRNKMNVVPTHKKSIEENLAKLEEYLKPNVTETMWTKEQDFDILCNFYDLSIDEARNRYNCPYMVIASRLETLVDSTEPQHIELLMEASKVIKARKAQALEEAKNGFWKRRKLRKQAKKAAKRQAKLDREIAKAERKLSKLKGE